MGKYISSGVQVQLSIGRLARMPGLMIRRQIRGMGSRPCLNDAWRAQRLRLGIIFTSWAEREDRRHYCVMIQHAMSGRSLRNYPRLVNTQLQLPSTERFTPWADAGQAKVS